MQLSFALLSFCGKQEWRRKKTPAPWSWKIALLLLRHGAGELAKEISRARQRTGIRIAVSAVDGIRRDRFFKPLQQRLRLRMVNKTSAPLFNPDGNGLVGQRLYRNADFQIGLASAREARELPRRNAI